MKRILLLLLCFGFAAVAPAQSPIAKKTEGMTAMPGFFPIYWDAKAGKIWLEINRWDKEFLYIGSLPAGVGSNDIGLDRGQLGDEKVVQFDSLALGFRQLVDRLGQRIDSLFVNRESGHDIFHQVLMRFLGFIGIGDLDHVFVDQCENLVP